MDLYPPFLRKKYSKNNIDEGLFVISGVLAKIILTKHYFNSNKEIETFTKDILNKNYKEYLFQSRNMLYARVTRDLMDCDASGQLQLINNILEFALYNNSSSQNIELKKNQKTRKSEKSVIQSWSEIIDPK